MKEENESHTVNVGVASSEMVAEKRETKLTAKALENKKGSMRMENE